MRLYRPKSISFAPFFEEARTYQFSYFKDDALAALAVALMTIPQSLAYALLAGLPPTAGLFSAIFGTIFAATFGSSRQLVTGPSTGTAILLQTALSDVLHVYYPMIDPASHETFVLHILTQFVIIMGILQIALSFFNVSKLLQFVSRSVILAYFAGISSAICVTQAFGFTGVKSPGADQTIINQAWYFCSSLSEAKIPTLCVAIFSLAVLVLTRRVWKNCPHALIMLVAGSLFAKVISHVWHMGSVATLGDFHIAQEPIPHLTVPFFDFELIPKIFPSALALSLLAILEVFSISRAFALKSQQKISVNQDVFGLGISNFILSFVSGAMPTSGSATRTSLNFSFDAKTRFSAIFSGIFAGVIIVFCWPLVKNIPLASLSALLIATVPTLVEWKEIKFSFKATREDAFVFVLTFLSCLILTLDVAFFLGIVLSIGNYLKKTATPHLMEYAFNSKGRLMTVNTKTDVHRKVRIIGIGGDLYFATADVFQSALESVIEDQNVQAIVLRLNNVYHMDASMCLAIMHLHEVLEKQKRYLVISGLTEEVWHVFHRAGMVKTLGLDNLYFTDESNPQFSTWKACLRAQELIHTRIPKVFPDR
jgi:SulP family sulfate permease